MLLVGVKVHFTKRKTDLMVMSRYAGRDRRFKYMYLFPYIFTFKILLQEIWIWHVRDRAVRSRVTRITVTVSALNTRTVPVTHVLALRANVNAVQSPGGWAHAAGIKSLVPAEPHRAMKRIDTVSEPTTTKRMFLGLLHSPTQSQLAKVDNFSSPALGGARIVDAGRVELSGTKRAKSGSSSTQRN